MGSRTQAEVLADLKTALLAKQQAERRIADLQEELAMVMLSDEAAHRFPVPQ